MDGKGGFFLVFKGKKKKKCEAICIFNGINHWLLA